MPDQITPVEAVIPNQLTPEPKKEDPGFLDKGGGLMNAITSVGNFFQPVVEPAKNVVSTVATGKVFDVFDGIDDQNISSYQPVKLSDKDNQRISEIKNLSGGESVWDMITGLGKIAGNKMGIVGEDLNLKTDKKVFDEKMGSYQSMLQKKEEILNQMMQSPDFSEYVDFQKNTQKKYLESKGVDSIQDANDYAAFIQNELNNLPDVFQKNKFIKQQSLLEEKSSGVISERNEIEAQMKKYISDNVDGGEESFKKYQTSQANLLKDNKFFSMVGNIRSDAEEEWDKKFAENGVVFANFGSSYRETYDSFIDDVADDKKYMYGILASDLPDKEKIAQKFKESSDIAQTLKFNALRDAAAMKNNPEFKDMEDIEIKKKAIEKSWNSLTDEQKRIYRNRETLITGIDQVSNVKDLKKNLSSDAILDKPLAALDAMNYAGTTVQRFFDQVFDVQKDGVPHYVAQDTRNLIYASEGNWEKLKSVVSYNPDEILSLVGATKGVQPIKVGTEKFIGKVFDTAEKVMTNIPVNVGFGKTAITIASKGLQNTGKLLKGVAGQQIEGAAQDPILDNAMQEAPSNVTDQINRITNLLFDTALIPAAGGALNGGLNVAKKTNNSIMYNFMTDSASKNVVSDFVDAMSSRGMKISKTDANEILKKGKNLYYSMFDPKAVEETFSQPGKLYEFLSGNIKQMDDVGIKTLLTEKGLGIELSQTLAIPKDEIKNINQLYSYVGRTDIAPEKSAMVNQVIQRRLDDYNAFTDGKTFAGIRVEDRFMKDPEYAAIATQVKNDIVSLKTLASKPGYQEEIAKHLDRIHDGMDLIQNKFTNYRSARKVSLVNMIDPKSRVDIDITDLEQLSGKNFLELAKSGKITIPDGEFRGEWNFLKSAQDKQGKAFYLHVRKHKDVIKEFMQKNSEHLSFDAKKTPLDSMLKTVENIISGKSTIELGFARKAKNVDEANEILKDFSKMVTGIFEDFYGEGTLTHINDINSMMKSGSLKVYDSVRNLGDTKAIIDMLNNQDGKFNLSHGSFVDKEGNIKPILYVSFGKEFNSEEFAHKLTGSYKNSKGEDSYSFANYINSFSDIHAKIIQYGFDKAGMFSLERGLAKARTIESAGSPISLFTDGKLDRVKVMDLIKDSGLHNEVSDREIADAIIEMFGSAHESQNNFVRAMAQNFLYNYVKNRDLVIALFKKVGKEGVTMKNQIDAISHIVLNNDEDLIKDIVGKYTRSQHSVDEMERLMEKLGPTIKQSVQGWKDNLLIKQTDIEEQISNLKATKRQMTTASQKETVQFEIDNLIQRSKAIDNQIGKSNKILSEKTFDTLENMYKQYLLDSASRFSQSLFSDKALTQKILSEHLDDWADIKSSVKNFSDEEKYSFQEFKKKLITAKNDENYQALADLSEQYKNIDGSENYKKVINFFRESIFSPGINAKFYDVNRLVKALSESMGVYEHDFILMRENNPVIKSIGSLLNNNSTGQIQEVNDAIFKEFGGEAKTLVDLYHDKTSTFKEFIDSLYSTNDVMGGSSKKVESLLKKVFSGMVFKTEKSANVLDELITAAMKDRSFIDRFKKIARMEKRPNVLSVSEQPSGKYTKLVSEVRYEEIPLQVKALIDGDSPMDMKIVSGIKSSDFISKGLSNIEAIEGETAEETYKRFINEFNGNIPSTFDPKKMKELFGNNIGEYIFVGNFGDKDSLFQFYRLPDSIYSGNNIIENKKIAQEFYAYDYAYRVGYQERGSLDELKKAVSGSTSYDDFTKKLDAYAESQGGQLILDIQKIRKRESAAMSTFSTFEGVKKPLSVYVLEEYHPKLNPILQPIQDIFLSSKNPEQDVFSLYGKQELMTMLRDSGDTSFLPEFSDRELFQYLEMNYGKDLEDGTSYVSLDLAKTRQKIRGTGDTKQFKDHFYGIAGDGKAVLGKTLFNSSSLKIDGKASENTVLIGASSLKLKGGYSKFDKPKTIIVDGIERKILGEVSGTDTSFFRNASSDSHSYDSNITFSDSIKTKLRPEYIDEIENIQLDMIDEAFNRYLGGLSDYKINTSTIDDVMRSMYKISSITESGIGSNVILKEKVKLLVSEINRIINKPVDEGQSMFIRRSDRRISPNEIIVSRTSPLVLTAQNARKKVLISQGVFEGTPEFTEMMNRPYYSVSYRYPVPSEYNLGVYKMRFSDEFPEYKLMGDDQVVAHPQTTYMKVEGDNDGDHLFFLPTDTRIGNVTAKAVLGIPVETKLDDVIADNLVNKYILTPQVEKDQVLEGAKRFDASRLIQSRSVALEAKSSIGKVAATIRTLYFIGQSFEDIIAKGKESKWYKEEVLLGRFNYDADKNTASTITFGDLYEKYGMKYAGLSDDFKKKSAKTLQLAVDFGASDATEFPKNWAEEMIQSLGIDDVDKFYNDVVNPLATTYNTFNPKTGLEIVQNVLGLADPKKLNRDVLYKAFYKKGDTLVPMVNPLNNNFRRLTGSKRSIYKRLAENENIIKHFVVLENNYDPGIAYKLMGKMSDKKTIQPLIDIMSKFDTINSNNKAYSGYLKNSDKTILRDALKDSYPQLLKEFDKIEMLYQKVTSSGAKREKYEKLAEYFTDIAHLSDEEKMIRGMYAFSVGEQNVFNFLGDIQKIQYLFAADEKFSQSLAELYDGTGIDTPILSSYKNADEYRDALRISLSEIDAKLNSTEEMTDYIKENLVHQKTELEEKLEGIINVDKPIVDEDVSIKESIDVPSYNLPEIPTESIASNPQAMNEILSEHTSYVSLAKDGIKLTMESLFNKYAPTLLVKFDSIQSYLNSFADRRIELANRVHVSQFSDNALFGLFGDKNSIYQQLKKIGLIDKEISDISRKIQKEFLTYSNGEYKAAPLDVVERNLSALFTSMNLTDLTKTPEFMKRVGEYHVGSITPVAEAINGIQKYLKYDIHSAYEKLDFSMVTDIFEASKGDAQLSMKLEGIQTKDQFLSYIQKNADIMGETIWQGTKNAMANTVFKQTPTVMENLLGFFQAFHYQMSYGTAATLIHQGNIIAGFAQLIPNYVELRAHLNANISQAGEALRLMQRYNLMKYEDQLIFGTGHGKNIMSSQAEKIIGYITKDAVEGGIGFIGRLTKLATGKDIPRTVSIRAAEHVDGFVNNILGYNDLPLEELRKVASIMDEMEKLGFKTADEMISFFDRAGDNAVRAFESRARHGFVNSGGGAVSSSSIGRGTVFENSYEYFNNWLVRFFVKANSYLMGWSFHKMATLIEKETALFTGVRRLISGDTKGFKSHLNDWISYNTMLGRQFAYTTGIFLKFQKFEDDNEDRMDLFSFQKQFTNLLVAWEIMLGRHIDAWNTAGEYGDGIGDQVGFTAFSLYKKTLRLFAQPAFIRTFYDKYRSDKVIEDNGGDKADIMSAFNFAVDQHYKSFMTFNAMQHTNDIFDTIQNGSNLGLLAVGGQTQKEELLSELITDKTFASFKDNGLLQSLLSFWGKTLPQKEMSGMVTASASKKIAELIMTDPSLAALVNGGEIGKEYMLQTLLGSSKSMSDAEKNATKNLWNSVVTYKAYYDLDEKGRRILYDKATGKRLPETVIPDMLERQIDDQLAKQGLNWQDVFTAKPGQQRDDLKTMAVLAYQMNISTPRMLSYLMNKEYSSMKKDLSKKYGVKGESGYAELPTQYDDYVKRQVLLKYQDKINLDRDSVFRVIEQDVVKNKGQLLAGLEKEFQKDFVEYNVYDILKSDYLVHQVMKNGDTSVSALQSKYALAYKGMPDNETSARIMIKHLEELNNLPFMDNKTKLANQAAIIMGMGKVYNTLKDNKKFQELTGESQKLISNWLYKISSDANDYDTNSPSNGYNHAAYTKSYTGSFKPKYQSSAYSDKRPNYSKQFGPMRNMMNGKQQYLDSNPDGYLNDFQKKSLQNQEASSLPIGFDIKVAQMPTMVEYTKFYVQEAFRGFTSRSPDNKPDGITYTPGGGPQTKTIKMAKPKKAKGKNKQKITGRKPPLHYSKGVRPDLPFSNYEGG